MANKTMIALLMGLGLAFGAFTMPSSAGNSCDIACGHDGDDSDNGVSIPEPGAVGGVAAVGALAVGHTLRKKLMQK